MLNATGLQVKLYWSIQHNSGKKFTLFCLLAIFAYQLLPIISVAEDTEDLWTWRGRRYLLRAVPVDAYRQRMRVRSPRWGTVGLPGAVFRELVRPLHYFLLGAPAAPEECPF